MSQLLHIGEILTSHACRIPDALGAMDSKRRLTFAEWNTRACRLAHAFAGMGLARGDRVAVLARNCIEWMEIYVAAAKAGVVVAPINFRLSPGELAWAINDSQAGALIVQSDFLDTISSLRGALCIPAQKYLVFGQAAAPAGFQAYEDMLAAGRPTEPDVRVTPGDAWTLLYTSGTTGRPKGVVRSHASYAAFNLVNNAEFGFQEDERGLTVMPLCHVNSIFYSFALTTRGGAACVHDAPHFDPTLLLRTLADWRITFTSLVPTHFAMLLDLPPAIRDQMDVACVRKLLISSAPARRELKLAVMAYFSNSQLFEAYGSTEAGLVTLLRPSEQFDRLGSIGREVLGSARLRLLDDSGREVPEGEVGELYSRTPMMFSHYWNQPQTTAAAFHEGYCTVGDMARRDPQGYYFLVDRKHNMIITGGEHVFPSEVEAVAAQHPGVQDVAVIGVPHQRWGEAVAAVVIRREGQALTAEAVMEFCRERLAGFKRPRAVYFIAADEMPRTATGKILHRVLREKYAARPPLQA